MHYVAIVNGEEREVEIVEVDAHRYQITIDGRTLEVDARPSSSNSLSLLKGERAYTIDFDHREGASDLLINGCALHVEVLDLRRMRMRKAQSAAGNGSESAIRSPMPGKVVAVLVEKGQQVTEGQGVVVVEAMKMENELRAPRAGTVTSLSCAAGDSVQGGVTLCTVE